MGAVGLAGVVTALVSARGLLPTAMTPATTTAEGEGAQSGKRRSAPGRIRVLAALAAMVMLSEGAANGWSAVHLKDILGGPAGTAAVGYGIYAAATTGPLLADRVSDRSGPMAVLRYGTVTAAVGITIVAVSPWIWAAFAGWALCGPGLSGRVPQLFCTAGRAAPSAASASVSRVAGLGCLGMFSGPAVIGRPTHLVALNHALLLPTLLCAGAAAAAGLLRTASGHTREAARSSH
ncbi:MFS transporter [Streptomyces malaysiensis subsp. malaysiensis]|nr:MFS transporter [Streptomyces malaysiensis]